MKNASGHYAANEKMKISMGIHVFSIAHLFLFSGSVLSMGRGGVTISASIFFIVVAVALSFMRGSQWFLLKVDLLTREYPITTRLIYTLCFFVACYSMSYINDNYNNFDLWGCGGKFISGCLALMAAIASLSGFVSGVILAFKLKMRYTDIISFTAIAIFIAFGILLVLGRI